MRHFKKQCGKCLVFRPQIHHCRVCILEYVAAKNECFQHFARRRLSNKSLNHHCIDVLCFQMLKQEMTDWWKSVAGMDGDVDGFYHLRQSVQLATGLRSLVHQRLPSHIISGIDLTAKSDNRTDMEGSEYVCGVCGKVFSRNTHLRIHRMIHTGEKPHVCKVCGKGFNQRGNLNAHMRIHTGERPFSCAYCQKDFVRSNHLKAHIRLYHSAQWTSHTT